ncbi:MAG TPA: NlpC/P60 family protein [Actinomycetota bacterium]
MRPSRPLRRLVALSSALACLLALQTGTAGAGAPSRPPGLAAGDRDAGIPSLARAPAPVPTNGIVWSDVDRKSWVATAIDYVGAANPWMLDYRPAEDGTYPFRPDRPERRSLFARSLVRAFAPGEMPDPAIVFPDLPGATGFARFANVAVKLGWMQVDADGNFLPSEPVTPRMVHRAVVLALGLGDLAAGADQIHLVNGTTFQMPADFGTLLVGMRIGLRYNHGDEALDVGPDTPLSRAEVAWSLYRAATMPSWMPSSLAGYSTITLPNLGPAKQRIVQFAIDYVGYPYVYGGDWYEASPSEYCCGTQPTGGFDCSGLAWWVIKAAEGGWSNQPPREYLGWSLLQRTSAQMASTGTKIPTYRELRSGDLMFYDGNDDGIVDHVDVYVGRGWAVDSSSSVGGVTIMWVGSGWYRDHFVWGRRVLGTTPA